MSLEYLAVRKSGATALWRPSRDRRVTIRVSVQVVEDGKSQSLIPGHTIIATSRAGAAVVRAKLEHLMRELDRMVIERPADGVDAQKPLAP